MLKATKFVEQKFALSVKTMFSYQCQGPGQHSRFAKIMTCYHLQMISEESLIFESQDVSVTFKSMVNLVIIV